MAGRSFNVILRAADDESRRRGLMFTDPLEEDECALFVFSREADHGFWNKDVSYDLSLAFCDRGGRILGIRDMRADSRLRHACGSDNVKYVVEVARGALEGIDEGDRMIIDNGGGKVEFQEKENQM
jgi:uncharacterized membrane protein (UPF0127 family)